ncbi:MAG: hypothetical protein AUG44_27295 [Actinobacteria bacterium 13_1_20CM_3_71_11]|nr:MAG: hypothetical protein AUG44_27295 [Actinobacteria bacterium 13_1_20CM_3_71_11]
MAAKTDTSPETPDTGTICAAETVLPAEPDPAAASGPRFCSAACFHAWHRHQHDEVVTVLHSLDPDRSGGTGVVADWLRCRGGPQNVTQLALCEFLGYQLPVLAGSVAERRAIAASLGTVFTAARLTRYAQLCAAPTTERLLRTYDEDGVPAGREAYQRALVGSGIVPPDLPELTWGTTMGEAEVQAYESTAAMLELAVTAGYLRPGTTGWRVRQVQLTRAYLHADVDGTSRLDAIRTERVEAWSRSRGTGRRRLVGEVASRVRAPLAIPSDADESMAPLQWLLDRAGDGTGVPLDEAYRLDDSVVAQARQWFGSDHDGQSLEAVRELLYELRALRRTGRRLVVTRIGRELLDDPDRMWAAAVATLVGAADDLGSVVREAALMILLGRQAGREELTRRLTEVAAGDGWLAPDARYEDIRTALLPLLRRLLAMGLLADERWLRPIRLTPLGQAAAVAALRARAMRPRRTLAVGGPFRPDVR